MFDIIGARNAGYSDSEIAQDLAKTHNYNYSAAVKAGYSDQEILGELLSYEEVGKEAPKKSLYERVKEKAKGLSESQVADVAKTVGSLLTTPVQQAVSGYRGAAATLGALSAGQNLDEALSAGSEAIGESSEKLAYKPESKAGQAVEKVVSYPFQKWSEAGEYVVPAKGHPVSEALQRTAWEFMPFLAASRKPKAPEGEAAANPNFRTTDYEPRLAEEVPLLMNKVGGRSMIEIPDAHAKATDLAALQQKMGEGYSVLQENGQHYLYDKTVHPDPEVLRAKIKSDAYGDLLGKGTATTPEAGEVFRAVERNPKTGEVKILTSPEQVTVKNGKAQNIIDAGMYKASEADAIIQHTAEVAAASKGFELPKPDASATYKPAALTEEALNVLKQFEDGNKEGAVVPEAKAKNIVFLDMDGVLNTKAGREAGTLIDPEKVALYNKLVADPETKVVVSSSWRSAHTPESFDAMLAENGATPGKVIGITPDLGDVRGAEIQAWLDAHQRQTGAKNVAVLDDRTDLGVASKYQLATKDELGLLPEHVQQLTGRFAGEPAPVFQSAVVPGLKEFAEQDLMPAMKKGGEYVGSVSDSIKKIFAPASRTTEARATSLNLRELGANHQQALDLIDEAIAPAKAYFDKQGGKATDLNSRSFQFVKSTELGNLEALPEVERPFAKMSYDLLDGLLQEVQKRGRLRETKTTAEKALSAGEDDFLTYYFPRLWKDPVKARSVVAEMVSKRPFEGKKAFLKQRSIDLYEEGIKRGLEPAFDNPMEMVFHKAAEISKWNMAQDFMQMEKAAGRLKFVRPSKQIPAGWKPLDDRMGTVYGRSEKGEMVIRGRYVAPEASATVFNNLVSKGLSDSSAFRGYRYLANAMNQMQLGLSAFHAGFTSLDAMVSSVSLGVYKASRGNVAAGIRDMLTFPVTPVTNAMMGHKMSKAWFNPGSQGPAIQTLIDAWKAGGGRARMDKFYGTSISENAVKALRHGNVLGAAFRAPFAIVEQSVRPVLEWLVPRQKMGIGAKMLEYELKRNPNMSHAELQELSAKIVDSVDNRMGQLAYDNLFWNKTAKDLGLASVRSLGWNLGTWRELGGAILDIGKQVKSRKFGGLSHRQAYALSLPITVGLLGAIYQYLATGEGPQELIDYYFPKTGTTDEKGRPERVALPSYMKDLYHYAEAPGQTLVNKIHPALAATAQMLQNKDFYGTEIRHPDDPLAQQLLQYAAYGVESMKPFSIRNMERQHDLGMGYGQAALSQIGITPAPASISKTAAEKVVDEIQVAKLPQGARTKEAFEAGKLAAKLRRELAQGKPGTEQAVADAFTQSKISRNQLKDIYESQGKSSMERGVKSFNLDELQKVMEKASPAEREILNLLYQRKLRGQYRNWPYKQVEEDKGGL